MGTLCRSVRPKAGILLPGLARRFSWCCKVQVPTAQSVHNCTAAQNTHIWQPATKKKNKNKKNEKLRRWLHRCGEAPLHHHHQRQHACACASVCVNVWLWTCVLLEHGDKQPLSLFGLVFVSPWHCKITCLRYLPSPVRCTESCWTQVQLEVI